MAKRKSDVSEEQALFNELSQLIEQSQLQVVGQVNSALTMLFWYIGYRVNQNILQNKRADYGKQIVVTLSRQLSWSHILVLLPLKNVEAKLFYASSVAIGGIGVRELRKKISGKEFERTVIANLQNTSNHPAIHNNFKDPYFLDFLGLQNTYLEGDLEEAILKELEAFILELGKGFAFIERQKRMIIDGQDFHLDLLFYHRNLKRLVAIELKLGKFEAKHKGQMELYLKWLDRYERKEGELSPVGLILCAESSREQVELLEMHKDGIMVAEYWTELPPKKELKKKIHTILIEARERIERKKLL
ncbi:MAG TPA: PDDEXK nuclease domain-containing protein [Flavitalea sp.]|nr:PDDEXK nuclease domain-containing protein [Flavitalea sp.]